MQSLDHTNFRVSVLTTVLLQTLKVNRDKHNKDFAIALNAYRKKAIEELAIRIEQFKSGDPKINCSFDLQAPSNHKKDYDMAIEMIELHQEETFSLDTQQYRSLVKDQWDWSSRFYSTVNVYSPELSADFLKRS